jgi:hypothetical protein
LFGVIFINNLEAIQAPKHEQLELELEQKHNELRKRKGTAQHKQQKQKHNKLRKRKGTAQHYQLELQPNRVASWGCPNFE